MDRPTTPRQLIELTLAYDATVEGFARALDMREGEAVGHTLAVAKLTVELAQACGVTDPGILHNIKLGALLHDIGKIAIPDSILLKPNPLTDEEWAVMRKHPQYAYDLLSPISYLTPALDIPMYHHEKWDGTGYLHGLKASQIPRAARIFAVADVWDALTSDRPYRKGWSKENALTHIAEGAGKHFDPQVVQAFLEMRRARP